MGVEYTNTMAEADQWSAAADAKYKELRGRIFKAASTMGVESSSPSSSLAVVPPLSLSSVSAEEQGTICFQGQSASVRQGSFADGICYRFATQAGTALCTHPWS